MTDADGGRTLDDLLSAPREALRASPGTAGRLLSEIAERQVRLSQLQAVLVVRAAGDGTREVAADRLLTMEAVAELLAVPVAHAREMGRRHEIPTVHVGRYVRVRESALQAWLREREEAVGTLPPRAYSPRPKRGERRGPGPRVVPLHQNEGTR